VCVTNIQPVRHKSRRPDQPEKKRPTLIDKINAEKVQNKTSKDKVGKRSALHY
jgi:hypothetical protein